MTHVLWLIWIWTGRGVICAAVLAGALVLLGELAGMILSESGRRQRARRHAADEQRQWDQHVTGALGQAAELVPSDPGESDWQLWEAECGRGRRRG